MDMEYNTKLIILSIKLGGQLHSYWPGFLLNLKFSSLYSVHLISNVMKHWKQEDSILCLLTADYDRTLQTASTFKPID